MTAAPAPPGPGQGRIHGPDGRPAPTRRDQGHPGRVGEIEQDPDDQGHAQNQRQIHKRDPPHPVHLPADDVPDALPGGVEAVDLLAGPGQAVQGLSQFEIPGGQILDQTFFSS
jgi:hypothetical protein